MKQMLQMKTNLYNINSVKLLMALIAQIYIGYLINRRSNFKVRQTLLNYQQCLSPLKSLLEISLSGESGSIIPLSMFLMRAINLLSFSKLLQQIPLCSTGLQRLLNNIGTHSWSDYMKTMKSSSLPQNYRQEAIQENTTTKLHQQRAVSTAQHNLRWVSMWEQTISRIPQPQMTMAKSSQQAPSQNLELKRL